MNLVDLFIIVAVVLAAVHGVTQGAAMQVLSFGGFWIGLVVGAAIAPIPSHFVSSSFAKAFISLVIFFGFALVGGAIGRYFGTHAWGALRRARLGGADSAFGAIVAVVAALAAVWLIALLLTAGPTPSVANTRLTCTPSTSSPSSRRKLARSSSDQHKLNESFPSPTRTRACRAAV